ncbi:hypothetical protein CEXT_571681 [Caerostris extrusa]|uniref:Uncharacterized protein n=1 Tax=Caerostris extrusa TaxID=172846 RepID=A0AAV4PM64_CAEEX|nr:hypothetical protein CEXT_571681 [Caerostris extrusa]
MSSISTPFKRRLVIKKKKKKKEGGNLNIDREPPVESPLFRQLISIGLSALSSVLNFIWSKEPVRKVSGGLWGGGGGSAWRGTFQECRLPRNVALPTLALNTFLIRRVSSYRSCKSPRVLYG